MCLLKPNDQNNNCTHDECKRFDLQSKSSCLFSLNQASRPAFPLTSAIFSSVPQPQSRITAPQFSQPEDFLLQASLINPRDVSNNQLRRDDCDEEVFSLNNKKVKVEGNNNMLADSKPVNIFNSLQPKGFSPIGNSSQATSGNSIEEKSLFNTPLLNNILLGTNPQASMDHKRSNMQVLQPNQPIYIPYIQAQLGTDINTIPGIQGIQSLPLIATQQQQQQPQGLGLSLSNFAQPVIDFKGNPQAEYMKNTPPSSNGSNAGNSSKSSNAFNVEEYLATMQNRFVEVLTSQNKMLIDLKEKNDLIQDTIACLINEVNALKQAVKQTSNHGSSNLAIAKNTLMGYQADTSREVATTETLLKMLYGPNANFDYQLVFKNELPLPLYRERNFKFAVYLTDKEGNLVKNSNKIPLTLSIYTSESAPKYIDVNTSGNKILKGMIDKDLVEGVATFDRIQVKEVTSHFRNGWVFFVVSPKHTGVVLNNFVARGNGVLVDQQMVKPLILERVTVKAKKAKEANASKDADEDQELQREDEQGEVQT